MAELTPKQQAFIIEYLVDRNATQAAIRAGYSPKTATEQASRLLTNVNVKSAIEAKETRLAVKVERTRDQSIQRLIDIGNAALADGQYTPAITAETTIARMLGYLEPNQSNAHKAKSLSQALAGVAVNITVTSDNARADTSTETINADYTVEDND